VLHPIYLVRVLRTASGERYRVVQTPLPAAPARHRRTTGISAAPRRRPFIPAAATEIGTLDVHVAGTDVLATLTLDGAVTDATLADARCAISTAILPADDRKLQIRVVRLVTSEAGAVDVEDSTPRGAVAEALHLARVPRFHYVREVWTTSSDRFLILPTGAEGHHDPLSQGTATPEAIGILDLHYGDDDAIAGTLALASQQSRDTVQQIVSDLGPRLVIGLDPYRCVLRLFNGTECGMVSIVEPSDTARVDAPAGPSDVSASTVAGAPHRRAGRGGPDRRPDAATPDVSHDARATSLFGTRRSTLVH
jgi:hypothetical protein